MYPLSELARQLRVGLQSPGLCPACLGIVAMELESGGNRKIAGAITQIAPILWDEGFDVSVQVAIERAVRDGVPDAADAQRDFEKRGFRSTVFRAVVRRLAEELDSAIRRDYLASLN